MDIKKIFSVQQKVEIVEYDFEAKKQYIYTSRIEDIKEEQLVIAEPYFRGFYLARSYNKEYEARVIAPDCIYKFRTKLLQCTKDPIILWTVAMPKEVHREQRREYVRIDVKLDIEMEILTEDGESRMLRTATKNISGNGMCVFLKKPEDIDAGAKVKLSWSLGEDKNVHALGTVLRVLELDGEVKKYAASIQFSKVDNRHRNWLFQYIFKKQIEWRQKAAE